MAFDFARPDFTEMKPRISVFGVGGAGCNAVANMIGDGLQGVDFVVANTDAQTLSLSPAPTRIQLGPKITQGLGAGARPEIGAAAAEEVIAEIDSALEGVHMAFITAGMGGGTGTGAAPVVARAARERGVLTVGVVTKPFAFEGKKRMAIAEEGIAELQAHVDTLIIIPNQNLFLVANQQTTFRQAFQMADEVLNQGVRGVTDLMLLPGLINLDFADVRTVMSEMGKAMMGTGEASGERRAIEAAEKAISNPLLDEVSLKGARAVLINITGGEDLGLMEVEEAAQHIRDLVDSDANIILGSAFDGALDGRMRVSVVATGIEARAEEPREAADRQAPAMFGGVAPSLWNGRSGSAARAQPGVGESPLDEPPAGGGGSHRPGGGEGPSPSAPPPFQPQAPEPLQPVAMDASAESGPAGEEEPSDPAETWLESVDEVSEDAQPAAMASEPEVAETPALRLSPREAAARRVVELPLPEPLPRPARHQPEAEPEAGRRPTLFERVKALSRRPRPEARPVETLAPEVEPAATDDIAIPPFLRQQRN